MSEHDPATGARRRRRESEREARRAAEQSGLALPLTRRELRRRQLEEQARLEAIATGELPNLGEDGLPAGPEEVAARLAEAGTRPAAHEGSTAEGTGTAGPSTEGPRAPAPGRAPSGRSAAPVVRRRPVVPAPTSSYARTPSSPAEAARSRRSMPERLPEAGDQPAAEGVPAQAADRTTHRPVVRAPHTARGVRRLDETGTLTGVQPIVRPAAESAPARAAADVETGITTDPAGWESAVALPVVRDGHPTVPDADEPASAASPGEADEPVAPSVRASAPAGPEAVAAAALPPSDDEARPLPSRPGGTSGAVPGSPDEAERTEADRGGRPLHEEPADGWRDDVEPDDGVLLESGNPSASLVKIIALVLAAIVIGLLVWLLWFNNDDGGGAGSGAETRGQSSAGALASAKST